MALPVSTTYPLILPLAEAAQEMGVTEEEMRLMVQSGKARAFVDPEGTMYVQMTLPLQTEDTHDDINDRLSRIRREDYAHLEGIPITVSEAAKKYEVPSNTLYKWVLRKYITILGETRGNEGRPGKLLNEAEVAYCAAIYKVRKPFGSRAPLLDSEGKPYLLKDPQLARLRRRAKQGL